MDWVSELKRITVFLLGLLVLAFGIAVSTVSGLGISPLNCLAYVIGEIAGVQMGYITMILYVVYVFIEFLIKGRDFRGADLLQIPVAILFGFFVNWTKGCLSVFVCTNYFQRILCTFLSVILIAAGTTIYVVPKLVYQAPEGLIMAICGRWHQKFGTVKAGFDITIVVLAFLAGVFLGGGVMGIREGTLFAAFGVGLCVNFFGKTLKPWLEQLICKEEVKKERENA